MKKIYNKELQTTYYEPDCVEEWLELIYDIGYDCNGHNTVDGLKVLIGELMDMVLRACNCLRDGKVYVDDNYIVGDESK